MTVKEAAELWGISIKTCAGIGVNQIELLAQRSLVMCGPIPKNAERPKDGRLKSGKYVSWRNKKEEK
ncbi:hypothetical protein [Pseudobutyrivibrio ruminis]|uniref:hypothetical protein n=1 Tax=Pseudobutyrivibrio ruminis TaxID=46206 RepID=UPI00051C1F7E|nr:hypothetical protein [Pseudobutyrivibrio ruminis]